MGAKNEQINNDCKQMGKRKYQNRLQRDFATLKKQNWSGVKRRLFHKIINNYDVIPNPTLLANIC